MLTEYEQRREARIARNREILMQLVGNLPAHAEMMLADTSPVPKASGAKRKARPSVPPEEQRRSGRIRNMPAPIYTSFEVDEDLGDAHARAKRRAEKRAKVAAARAARGDASRDDPRAGASKPRPPAKPSAPPAKGSIKTLDAKMRECATEYLGAPIFPPPGDGALKAAVIHALSPISNPRFSKYSGIQEWKNCVTLFVNVGDKNGNSYDNVFTHAGGRISWFAQPRQTEETPVIERILATAEAKYDALQDSTAPEGLRDPEAAEASEADAGADSAAKADAGGKRRAAGAGKKTGGTGAAWPLHLFCRMEGCEYVYCGRLRLMEHDPRKLPMKFTFRLLDAPLLRTSDDFLGLVDLADADASLGPHKEKAAAASKQLKAEKEARG